MKSKQMNGFKVMVLIVCLVIQVAGFKSRSRQDNASSQNEISLASGITIKPTNTQRNTIMQLLTSESNYVQFELLADRGTFNIKQNSVHIIEVEEGIFQVNVDTKVQSLHFDDDLIYANQLKMWKLFTTDITIPNQEMTGWTDNSSSTCGSIFMLGGFNNFAKGEVKKIYEDLPEHTQIRIVTNYHFIDQWLGEVGFMKINSHLTDATRLEYVWIQKYDTSKLNNESPINVCGSSYPEFQLSFPIDIVIPHNKSSLILAFGSTLETEDPAEASFGISGIQIYLQ